jgi:hypothetical protein
LQTNEEKKEEKEKVIMKGGGRKPKPTVSKKSGSAQMTGSLTH